MTVKTERIIKRTEQHRHFIDFDIAGFTYWDGALVLCDLMPGRKVRLEREEDNRFDPYAVSIWFGESKLGFIPRDMNQDISTFLEMGYEDIFDARIQRVSPAEHPEHQVSVIVYLNRKEEGRA